jgi:hypothetical protein
MVSMGDFVTSTKGESDDVVPQIVWFVVSTG